MRITVPHGFDAMTVTTSVPRDLAGSLCPWLGELAGDTLALAIDASTITAWSDEAALPPHAPARVRQLADDLAAIGFDGSTYTYVFEQDTAEGSDASLARIDQLAAELAVTGPQRRIFAELHRALARGMTTRLSVRSRDGALDPVVNVAWDRVEWTPLQSMLRGFYPGGGAVEKIARLSRAVDADHATVELVLGPTDPPGVRFTFEL